MNLKSIISYLAAGLLSASPAFSATLADWTFEASVPSTAGPFSPEIGSGSALGFHAGASVYSAPAGNGSSHSFSSTLWAVGDYYQFQISTAGAQHLVLTYAQTSSSTGPGQFQLQYSTDGTHFTNIGAPYTVLGNGIAPNASWSATSASPVYDFTNDLSASNALNNAPAVYFRLVDAGTTAANGGTVATGGTDRVDNFMVTADTGARPVIASVSPSSQNVSAGNTATFTAILSGGDTPLSYAWYKITGTGPFTTNLIAGTVATNDFYTNYLDLYNVTEADAASYQLVVSNDVGINVTSAVVALTVSDPSINQEPVNQSGLLGGTAQFSVLAGGTGLTYQWYFADGGGNPVAPVPGTLPSGSTATGTTSATLQISNLHNADNGSNFVVVVSGTAPVNAGPQTSTAATLSVASTGVPLAFWTFNGNYLNITNPAPYQGIGTASAFNVTTFLQNNQDPDDSTSLTPNNAWGTDAYPATGLNKQAGVQFNTSTVGAKNINVSFDVRATTTPSKYQRLQFTTDGSTWIDYPASESLAGFADVYQSESYSLAGVPGVANNPNFGIRIVTEFESTARYNDTNDAVYVGVSTNYGTAGTLSYDIVAITGDAITNNKQSPVISAIPNQQMYDGHTLTVNFTVTDASAPVGSITFTATPQDSSISVSTSAPVNNNGSVTMTVNSSINSPYTYYEPIIVQATDANGNVATVWFTVEIDSTTAGPSITGLISSNLPPNCTLYPNSTLLEPFVVTDPTTAPAQMTVTAVSGNTTLLSNVAGNLSLSGLGTSNLTLHITPNTNQEGAVPVTVTATDTSSKSTSVTNYFEVIPNTNVVLVDYFNYNNNGSTSIVTNSAGLWQTHSGTAGQLAATGGTATIDGVHNTEDVNAQFIGAPYATNGPAVLYSSYIVNYTQLPDATGSYFAHFKDATTSNFLGRVWASSSGAPAGSYQLGIANISAAWSNAVAFPQSLLPSSNYVVVTKLVLSNFFSTLWINPTSESSPSVTDTKAVSTSATSITSYAFRESTNDEGIVTIAKLKVGLTFDSVLPSLQVQSVGSGVVVTWSDPTLGIQSATNVLGPWTDVTGAKSPYTNNAPATTMYYKFGR